MQVKPPLYRHHRGSGQALVCINGRRIYLGKHGTAESKAKYRQLVAEWLVRGEAASPVSVTIIDPTPITIAEVSLAYWKHADAYYRDDRGEPTGHHHQIRHALRRLNALYEATPAAEFGPLALAALQDTAVREGALSRNSINRTASIVRRMFRWAAGRELIAESVWLRLKTVEGLKRGRTTARESKGVKAIDDATVQKTLHYLPAPVSDMVLVQRLLGARPSEICLLRPAYIDRSRDVWLAKLPVHKTAYAGRDRVLVIGPQAQALLGKYLLKPADEACFVNGRGRPYDRDQYRRCIARACDRAGIAAWGPNRLRHAAATAVRAAGGLEAAQVILGHAKADVSQVYAERDLEKAISVARAIG
jgi:integrase